MASTAHLDAGVVPGMAFYQILDRGLLAILHREHHHMALLLREQGRGCLRIAGGFRHVWIPPLAFTSMDVLFPFGRLRTYQASRANRDQHRS